MSRYFKTKKNKAAKQAHQDIRNQPDSTNRDESSSDEEMDRELDRLAEKARIDKAESEAFMSSLFPIQPLRSDFVYPSTSREPVASSSTQSATSLYATFSGSEFSYFN